MGRKSVLEPIVIMQNDLYAGGSIEQSGFVSVKNMDSCRIHFFCNTANVLPLTMTVLAVDKFNELQGNGTEYSDGVDLDFGAPIFLDNSESDAYIDLDCKGLNTIKILLVAAPAGPGDEFEYKVTLFGKVVGA